MATQRRQRHEKPTTRRYTPEEKAQAVRLVRQLRAELGTSQGTVKRVAEQLGYGVESVRQWVRQAVELATLSWVAWYNEQRLHGYLGDVPPAEFEDAYHAPSTHPQGVGWKPIIRASNKPRDGHRGQPGVVGLQRLDLRLLRRNHPTRLGRCERGQRRVLGELAQLDESPIRPRPLAGRVAP